MVYLNLATEILQNYSVLKYKEAKYLIFDAFNKVLASLKKVAFIMNICFIRVFTCTMYNFKTTTMRKDKKNVLRKLGLGICIISAMSLSACSGGETITEEDTEVVGTSTSDIADDGMFDTNEFNTSFASTNYYEDWDMNDDNFLDEKEFNDSYYGLWDGNKNGMLEENEWNDNVKNFGLTNETWNTWDANSDKKIDRNEFNTAQDDNNYYSTWDMDKNNQLTEREYTDGLFGLWDDNDDGILEKDKYDTYLQ